MEALARAHLLEPSAVYGRWRMHDLLRLHSTHHGTTRADADQRDQALTRLLEYHLTTARAAGAHLDPTTKDRLGFPDRQHALAWLDDEYANLTTAALTAEQAGHPAIARDLPYAMWEFMEWRRYFNDWITLTHVALHAARTLDDRHGQARPGRCGRSLVTPGNYTPSPRGHQALCRSARAGVEAPAGVGADVRAGVRACGGGRQARRRTIRLSWSA